LQLVASLEPDLVPGGTGALESAEAFVVPAEQNLLCTGLDIRHVNLDNRILPNAVEPTDTLLE
jgi:hypothetical protein